MTPVEPCARCGSPTVGNETFCSNCGAPLGGGIPPPRRPVLLRTLAAAVVVTVVAIAGLYFAGRRVPSTGGTASRKVLGNAERSRDHEALSGCSLLTPAEASAIAGTAVTRTEPSEDGCAYFGVPDPALNPEADSIQELAGSNGDPRTANMIRQMTGAMRSATERREPDTRAGPGGERPLFTIQTTPALSLSMEAAKKAGPLAGGEPVPGLGDEAFFVTMHRMFFVRSGASYLLIQPFFVRDRRGVAIAAARKVLDAPGFRRLHS